MKLQHVTAAHWHFCYEELAARACRPRQASEYAFICLNKLSAKLDTHLAIGPAIRVPLEVDVLCFQVETSEEL
jgi:hypothetical protein